MNPMQVAAFEAVEAERAYQDVKWAADRTASGGKHTPTEWLVYIEDYVNEAKRYTSRISEPQASVFVQHTMRKIAAMAIASMEQNGIYTRKVEGPRPEGAVAIP